MTVSIERHEAVAIVKLDRPDRMNAITLEMRQQLWEAFEGFALDDDVRAIVLTGAGGHFCSGVDVGTMKAAEGGVKHSLSGMHTLQRMARAVHHCPKPTIAAVPGVCVGFGWGLALCCDIVIADDNVRFAQIFRNVALAPDGGSVWSLARLVGPMRARELSYSGRTVRAEEAEALGLVLEITRPETLGERALALAASFATGPTLAYELAKKQFALASSTSFDSFLDAEAAMQAAASRTWDHAEGVAAYREKRKPMFRGE